tara:strand:- start:7065 stop:7214 length:150 start_codon:yes stop_codon:yes gene_type:complete
MENKTVNSEKMIELSRELVLSIIERYDIKSYDEFTCPIVKNMAIELEVF